ncbi:MAG: patatin-like phospholipase family protein [Halorientalis sp.]
MGDTEGETRIAIGCQGGGSLTAFTAGALSEIIEQHGTEDLVAISGTSGGAMCATLAWDGLVDGDEARARANLRNFWTDLAANGFWEQWFNQLTVTYTSLKESGLPTPEVSPYDNPFSEWGRRQLGRLLTRYVEFDRPTGPESAHPALYLGAVDITTDRFRVFDHSELAVEKVLASASLPPLFPAMEIDGRYYWDGLLSENPPLGVLTDHHPDEIWIVQVNSPERAEEPRTITSIFDRRNELAGNLSLEQEVDFIEKVNAMVAADVIDDPAYKHIEVKRLVLEEQLSYAQKVNRDPAFLEDLFQEGQVVADEFLAQQG